MVRQRPSKGRGEYLRISKAIKIHTSNLSHVLKGDSNLTLEQGSAIADYFKLNEFEADYFLALIEKDRAGTAALKTKIALRLVKIQEQGQRLRNQVPMKEVQESDRAQYFSNWFYSAIRIATSVASLQGIEQISQRLNLPKGLVIEVLQFLVSIGYCVETDGKFSEGPTYAMIDSHSPLSFRHHANWRIKAIERHNKMNERELFFTCPASLSSQDQREFQEMLVKLTRDFTAKIGPSSPAEKLVCLGIDWFEF